MKNNKLVFLVLAFAFLLLAGIVMMTYLRSLLQGTTLTLGVDVYPRWIGTQEILKGASPYSLATRQKIWEAVYGSPLKPDGNPFGYYYPPAISTLLMPLVLAGLSVEKGAIFWCALSWALWATFVLTWSTRFSARHKWLLPILLVSGFLFRPAFSNYVLGQNALFCTLLLVGAWLATKNRKWVLGGVLASLSLIKPSISILPVGLLFLLYPNLKSLASFAVATLILYLPPTLLIGWWVPGFLGDITRYAVENLVSWSLADVKTVSGILWLLASAFLVFLGYRQKDHELMLAAALGFNAIFVPHTADYDLVAFVWLLAWAGSHLPAGKALSWPLAGLDLLAVWLPWLSLPLVVHFQPADGVEAWYRFIWLAYPVCILLLALVTAAFEKWPGRTALIPLSRSTP